MRLSNFRAEEKVTPDLVTVKEVASRLAMTERYVRRLIAEGQLPAYKIGRSVRVPEDGLVEFLASRRI